MFWRIVHNGVKFSLLVGAIVLALVSVMGEAGRVFPHLDIVNHFRPLIMIVCIGLLAAIMVTYPRPVRRCPALWLAVLTLGIQGSSLVPEIARSVTSKAAASPNSKSRKTVLRIATLNVCGGNRRLEQAADALSALDPDVIVLQEVWAGQKPLVALLKESFPHASECIAVSLCNVAILSRYPFRSKKVFRPEFTGKDRWAVPVARADLDLTKSGNAFAASIFATHLTWPNQIPLQNTQMRQLAHAVAQSDSSHAIVIGDFNSTPWSYGLAHLGKLLQMRRVTHALPTWPSHMVPRVQRLFRKALADNGLKPPPLYRPYLPIDHAFIGDALAAKSVKRVQIPGSDHYAVVIDIAQKAEVSAR